MILYVKGTVVRDCVNADALRIIEKKIKLSG